jgi:hypothetical protein
MKKRKKAFPGMRIGSVHPYSRVWAGHVQPKSFNKENRTELVDCMYNNNYG